MARVAEGPNSDSIFGSDDGIMGIDDGRFHDDISHPDEVSGLPTESGRANVFVGDDEFPHPDEVTAKAIDQLVSAELLRLSLEDREQVYDDIHGVSDQVEETPTFIQDKLQQLDHELKQMVQTDQRMTATGIISEDAPTYAYSLAVQTDAAYVEGRGFCLSFLRADQFDVGKAAHRMVSHFTKKLEYFGRDTLARDIRQDDLEPMDLQNLHCGSHQVLPSRDRAGRAVTIWIPRLKIDVPLRNKMRSAFYAYMDMSKSEETQRKGYVDILYLLGAKFDFCGRELAWKLPKLIHEAIPLRLVANHICYDKFFISPLIQLGMLSTGTVARLRLRSHYGSHTAILERLRSFGIIIHGMPFNEDGKPYAEQSRSDWEKRRKFESLMASNTNGDDTSTNGTDATSSVGERIAVPGPYDVLFGRGRNLQNHPGNKRFRSLIDRYLDRYEAADKQDKTILAYTIIRIVQEMNGRFLKDVDGAGYVEVDNVVAQAKVAHSFRSQRSAMKQL